MKRLAIFAGYDKHGIIDDYVVYYLEELKKVADIIFVYDNDFSNEELEKVKSLTIHQICKKHGEYDFGSYKRGYIYAKENNLLENYNQLIFCNDSVYGPFCELKFIFKEMEQRENNDFWSMFFERDYRDFRTKRDYCQSYFLVFNYNVFSSDCFFNFMSKVTRLNDKNKIIEIYELGISQCLLSNGFRCDGFISSPYNAPHDRRAIKIISQGFPFIKRSLFDVSAINANCFMLKNYTKVIPHRYPNFNLKLIENHLIRCFRQEDINYVLSRKFSNFNIHFLHRKIIRLKGNFRKNGDYRFIMAIFGVSLFKFTIPKRHTYKK